MFNEGDRVLIEIPTVWPKALTLFAENWRRWVKLLHNKHVKLLSVNPMPTSSGDYIEGYEIELDNNSKLPPQVSNWVPSFWVKEIPTSFHCRPCGGYNRHKLMCPSLRS
jgi:hypothetical protein